MSNYTLTAQKKQDHRSSNYLNSRRITAATADYFHITETRYKSCPALTYPVVGADGQSAPRGRVKYTDTQASRGRKYEWTGDTTARPPRYYHASGLDHVREANGELVIASGEVDLWTLYQVGFQAVLSWFGEGQRPADLTGLLGSAGVQRVVTYTDRDETGDRMARWLQDVLASAGIEYLPRKLPGGATSGTDVNKVWQLFDGDESEFRQFLESLPLLDLPAPAPTPAPAPRATVTFAQQVDANANELDEVRRRVCLEISKVLKPRRGRAAGSGYYECPIPGHGRGGKDFLFDPAIGRVGGCQGKHRGTLTRWSDLAAFLGVDVSAIARQVTEERRPLKTAVREPLADHDSPRHFPQGVPAALNTFLLSAHRDLWLAELPDLVTVAIVLATWTDSVNAGVLRDDEWLTPADLQRAVEDRHPIGRKTAEHGLGLLAELRLWERREICTSVDLYTDRTCIGQRKYKNVQYRARPLATALDDMWDTLAGRVRQRAFVDDAGHLIPDNARPYLNALAAADALTADEADALATAADARRRALYEQHAEQRTSATREYKRRLATLRRKYSYQSLAKAPAVDLPPGKLNARAFRRVLWREDLVARGGRRDGQQALQARYAVGVSRQAVGRWRTTEHVLAVPQYDTFTLDPRGDVVSQIAAVDTRAARRLNTIELVSSGGASVRLNENENGDDFLAECARKGFTVTARIRRPSAEVATAVANPDDAKRAAVESERQTTLRAKAAPKCVERVHTDPPPLCDFFTQLYSVQQALLLLDPRYVAHGDTLRDERTGELFGLTAINAWRVAAGGQPLVEVTPEPELTVPVSLAVSPSCTNSVTDNLSFAELVQPTPTVQPEPPAPQSPFPPMPPSPPTRHYYELEDDPHVCRLRP